jgi:hypothetical protein
LTSHGAESRCRIIENLMTDRKTRVLLISANDRLAAACSRRDDIEVYSLKERDAAGAASRETPATWEPGVDYAGGRKLSWRGVQAVREAIRRTQADVVHAFMSRFAASWRRRTCGTPCSGSRIAAR